MSERRPWIAYVAPVAFPEGGAAARRMLGNAKALVAAGYDVVIVSGQWPGAEGADFELAPGIRCVSVNERDAEQLPNALRYVRYMTMGARSRRWMDAQSQRPHAVILYSGYAPYLLQLTGWARRRAVPLIFDAVEWYTAASFPRFLASPYLWQIEFAMRVLIPRVDGVIAISEALEQYYMHKNMRVLRVPPLFDPTEIVASAPATDPRGRLQLAYAGSPGRKDLIDLTIEAVLRLDRGQERIVLNIVGLSEDQLRARTPLHQRGGVIPDSLRAHGRVSHARSIEVVGQADFTVLLRQPNRVATHGFPTKFVESLALGTPVIANITSDLAGHLRDGETGLVCPTPTLDAIIAALERALDMHTNKLSAMRRAARTEAERAFRYQVHAAALADLLGSSGQKYASKRTSS